MDSHEDSPNPPLVSRPSTAGQVSDDTVPETPDEGRITTEKTVGEEPTAESPLSRATTKEPVYLEGLPLVLVVACVTLVAFLILLDTSIIATVSMCAPHLGPRGRRCTVADLTGAVGNP